MPEEVNEAVDWLKQEAAKRGLADRFSATYERTENNKWLHFAVRLRNVGDISERAHILVDIEDAWNEREPHPPYRLFLVPTSG